MTQILSDLPGRARVLVIRLRSLGDCVLSTPAIRILKTTRPDLSVAVVVEPRFAGVYEGNPDVDCILEPNVKSVFRWRPTLTLNLHGGTRSMVLTVASAARIRAGFAHHAGSALYNVGIPRAQEILDVDRTVHTAEHLASAIFYLGAARCSIPRSCLFTDSSTLEDVPYAVIHPVAARMDKSWPAERFLTVAAHLRQEHGLEPVFIGSPADDLTAFQSFRTITNAPLSEIKSLLSSATLFVGNDSGPAHMAAAFGVPVVVVFGPSDPIVWAPWRVESEVISANGPIESIPVERVLAAVENLRVPR